MNPSTQLSNSRRAMELTRPEALQINQDAQPRTTWKSLARIGKLLFYVVTIGVLVLGFASSMGWSPAADAILGSLAASLGVVAAAGYSISKNWGVYRSDGKQKGNVQLYREINRIQNNIPNIEAISGRNFIIFNIALNGLAGLVALLNNGLNIPSKLDSEHQNVWYLGIPAAIIGGISALRTVSADLRQNLK
ncbi:MAG: hypothetical protein ACYC2P_13690 [Paludibacteraceae bacterium]